MFQIQTFPAPDFRQGPVPKITHIFGTGPCRKPVAGNFKPKMCYFRQRKKPKTSQNRKRAKKSLEFRQLKKWPYPRFSQQDFFHFLWVKMLPKNLPKIFRWPEMCPLDKILAQDFQLAAFTKILGRRDTSVVPLLSTENCKTLF